MLAVSVIVPNYNHAPYLKQRIGSILAQTYQDFELILLDDGSTDGSRDIMEGYRNNPHMSHIVYNEVNSGSAFRQWDKGIEMAQGEWVWIAESDDYADPTFLERLLTEATKTPGCTLAFANTWWVDEQGNKLWDTLPSDKVIVHDGLDFISRRLSVCNSIANVSECLFRRSAYRPAESHRYEQMRLCGDWFFYVLLAEQGNVVEVEEPLSYYRQHNANISSDAERRGLTFLEGADVLDYMIATFGLRPRDYSRPWGRLWANYEQRYGFPPAVRAEVSRRMAPYRSLSMWHAIYKLLRSTKAPLCLR